ncbi:MAG: lipid II flippase MurJ [Acidimicrobiia bacterium]
MEKIINALPRGTFSIASGMVVGAITGYVVVIKVNETVGTVPYAGFATFWSLIFVIGPGLFLPLEQEISRAISHRNAHKDGSAPIVRVSTQMAGILALIAVLVGASFSPIFIEHIFHNNSLLHIGFLIGIVSYGLLHCSRGVLSGNHKFGAYGSSLAAEGTIRFIAVLVLANLGVTNVGYYGLAMGIAPIFAVLPFSFVIKKLTTSGSPASKRELGTALGFLVTSSVLSQALAYSSLFLTNVLEGESGPTARYFTNAFFIARIPVIGFMAVQAALLPKLSAYHARKNHKEFRHEFKKLLSLVLLLSVSGLAFIAIFGTSIGKLLFKADKFQLSLSHFVILSLGSCIFLIAQTLLQACIALQQYKIVTIAYIFGVITTIISSIFFVSTDLPTTLWVSLSFSLGCVIVVAILWYEYEKTIESLVKAELNN